MNRNRNRKGLEQVSVLPPSVTKETEAGQVLVLMGQVINKYKKRRSTRIGPKWVIVVAEGGRRLGVMNKCMEWSTFLTH